MTDESGSKEQLLSLIDDAQRSGILVRIERREIEGESVWSDGFVVGHSDDWILLHFADNTMTLDGYVTLRVQDITRLHAPAPHHEFQMRALTMRGFAAVEPQGIDPQDVTSILRTASANYPLVAVHRELVAPDVCEIGRVESISDEVLVLHEIDADAEWEEESSEYLLSDVTRIDFDGGYETALAMVAGLAPGT